MRGQFLDAMSKVASTVNVITTDGPNGRAGMTITAMSSVSVETSRPSLLVCLNRSSSACKAILGNGVFCLNVLRDDQAHVSDVFAGRRSNEIVDRFSCTDWIYGKTGAPRMRDALVAFDCSVSHIELFGSHYVVFGEVLGTFIAPGGAPLIYVDRDYNKPCDSGRDDSTFEGQEKDNAHNCGAFA